MKKILYTFALLLSFSFFTSCEKDEVEPKVNLGYEDSYRLPDPTPMTPEDSAALAAIQEEYANNAK